MRRRVAFAGTALLAAAGALLLPGCSTIAYYAQAAGGHIGVLQSARPLAEVEADKATPPLLRERLRLAEQMREFASAELKLPRNASYTRYADLKREAVVWNVVAAPALSLVLKTWCFPVMGCVGYRGYYGRAAADEMAGTLRDEGLEVTSYGVPAYSTLGYSNWMGGDPLLNTFIQWPEGDLARLVFHELAHQVAYAADDTTFNESFAVAVERIGGRRWLARHATPAAVAEDALLERRRDEFRAFALRWREALQQVYAGSEPDALKHQRKAETMAAMRADYAQLKAERWAGWGGYDAWVAKANNASFGVMAAYNDLVPQFETLFTQRCGGDFDRFYAEVKSLAALPKAERRAKLASLS